MKLRIFGNEGIVHVTNRGVGRMVIFEDSQDYKYYISLMRRYSFRENIRVCAYCLMENHVHLLLHYSNGNVSRFMQGLCSMYARYYNKKYEHTGHVFQGRYDMENIYDEQYFLNANRYIIQNPGNAGICDPESYRWSSLCMCDSPNSFVDISLAVEILGGYENYCEFVTSSCYENDDPGNQPQIETSRNLYIDYPDEIDISDDITYEEAKSEINSYIKTTMGIENAREIKKLDRKKRNETIRTIKQAGYSIRTIERLTGIGRGIIQRA